MKTLFLGGKIAHHRALANRLHAVVPLDAICIVEPKPEELLPRLSRAALSRTLGLPFRLGWSRMVAHFDRLYPDYPDTEISRHVGVNSDSVIEVVRRTAPDLVIVSGTDLLRQPLIEVISATGRIMNLHTGISPYVKGGPHCTYWCLAMNRFDLIGNTVMWLDAGIDTGGLIATEQTPLTGSEALHELQVAVVDHGHDLYRRSVQRFCDGAPLRSVPQSELGPGRLFVSKDWKANSILAALKNYYLAYNASNVPRQTSVPLVALETD